jgi:hypothetical protein
VKIRSAQKFRFWSSKNQIQTGCGFTANGNAKF